MGQSVAVEVENALGPFDIPRERRPASRDPRARCSKPSGFTSDDRRGGSGSKKLFDALCGSGLVDALDCGKLAHEPIQSCLIDLSLAV